MGFLDNLFGGTSEVQLPTIIPILPPAAEAAILQGQLPQIAVTTIFLKKDEICHYMDKAILLKDKIKKKAVHRGGSYGMPGLFKGDRFTMRRGTTDYEEEVTVEQFRGILYITNKRIIFQAPSNGFDKTHTYLTSVAPYSNGVDLQYGTKTYSLLVPNGRIVIEVMNLIRA